MFTSPPSTAAEVAGDFYRPWATGMKETTVLHTHTVRVSVQHTRLRCSSFARASKRARNFSTLFLFSRSAVAGGAAPSVRRAA